MYVCLKGASMSKHCLELNVETTLNGDSNHGSLHRWKTTSFFG